MSDKTSHANRWAPLRNAPALIEPDNNHDDGGTAGKPRPSARSASSAPRQDDQSQQYHHRQLRAQQHHHGYSHDRHDRHHHRHCLQQQQQRQVHAKPVKVEEGRERKRQRLASPTTNTTIGTNTGASTTGKTDDEEHNDRTLASSILVSLSQVPATGIRPLVRPRVATIAPRPPTICNVIDHAIHTAGEAPHPNTIACSPTSAYPRVVVRHYRHGDNAAASNDDSHALRPPYMAVSPIHRPLNMRTHTHIGGPLPAAPILPNVAAGEIVL